MSEIEIKADTFFDRLSGLYAAWKQDKRSADGVFGGADSIVVITGKAESESSYQKNNALHVSRWLRQAAVRSSKIDMTSTVLATWL
jgi:nucleosome binding factor SPN SPT16 subunit